jgi:hypothetical protein
MVSNIFVEDGEKEDRHKSDCYKIFQVNNHFISTNKMIFLLLFLRECSNMNTFYISQSTIHGEGIFTRRPFPEDTKLFKIVDDPYTITPLGKKVNHSYTPNCELRQNKKGWYLYTKRHVNEGEELTGDYTDTPWFIKKPEPYFK